MGSASKKSGFTYALLKWYDRNELAFPWRTTKDPYRVWLSEIMLQQTQVKTVIPYFKRWLKDMPNVNAVACADLNYILKKWEGLGYYARARNFHSACKAVMKHYSGAVPHNYNDFLSLPGVGPYTAGAVMSIAYSLPIPAVDVNAYRLVSRLKSIKAPFNGCKNDVFRFLSDYISTDRPGDFNQAIMDIGRELCVLKKPLCTICPVQNYCSAFVNNVVDKYPPRIKRPKKPHHHLAVGIIWKNNKILITQRPERGLLGGLWEFPGGKIINGEGAKNCIIREVNEKLGICVRPIRFVKQIRHAYSHFSITLDAYHFDYINGTPKTIGYIDWRWVEMGEIFQLPFHRANHKLFDVLIKEATIC